MTPVSKMDLKSLKVDPREAFARKTTIFLARVFGIANGVKYKEARTGDTYAVLLGEFFAVNERGEEYSSDVLLLPRSVQDRVVAMVETAEGKPVKFGYDLYAEYSEKSSVGYQYAVTTTIKAASHDLLQEMATEMAQVPLPNVSLKAADEAKPESVKAKKK